MKYFHVVDMLNDFKRFVGNREVNEFKKSFCCFCSIQFACGTFVHLLLSKDV